MEQDKKMKVAMICHFSNSEVREHLPLSRRCVYRIARKLLHLPGKRVGYADIAPWDNNIIQCVKERDDIELYVLSAHGGLRRDAFSFDSEGIHYSFFRPELANFLRIIIPFPQLWVRLNPMAKKIQRCVAKIKPDLVLLVGAENAYYSSSVLGIKTYPVYVLCQNVINNPEYVEAGTLDKINAYVEMEIIKNSQYMAVYSQKHYELLRKVGYSQYVFDFNWPVTKQPQFNPVQCEKKDYDFVNFALHMSKEKGFHDCVKALSIVKQYHPNVKLCLVDGGPDSVRQELNKLIAELDLKENVSFISFFAERKDLFQFLQTVRFAVLPCKIDHISGTQIQSMQIGLPVICYKTTGTPSLNNDKECVLIAELNNVEQLAEKMLLLLDNPIKVEELKKNAIENYDKRHARSLGNMQRLVDNFLSIVDNFNFGKPIPKEHLFENQVRSL